MAIKDAIKHPNCYICAMIRRFFKEIDSVEFEFNPMNILKLQLFQVYVVKDETRHRFHMEVSEDGNFKIADPVNCPPEYLALESKLSQTILQEIEV